MASVSGAEWVGEKKQARVVTPRGARLGKFGCTVGGFQWLEPEEALFLLEAGALRLSIHGEPASWRMAFEALLDSPRALWRYTAVAHLNRHGYVCRPPRAGAGSPAPNPPQTGTSELHADYDVFVAESFKRSAAARGELGPKFRLLVVGYAEPPPALGVLRALAATSDVPLTVAVVGGSEVSLLSVEMGELRALSVADPRAHTAGSGTAGWLAPSLVSALLAFAAWALVTAARSRARRI
ncbi:hypothetical protein T492DRAFT_1079703 [Pavlovales sp. CCMP2436]|nr:hypothetical protein T492DRAFT_1079703 [Pavlovales sp. CCMP2436]